MYLIFSVFKNFFSLFRDDQQPQMCVCYTSWMPSSVRVVFVLLSGQMLVSVVEAPLQFYYLNTGTGNQWAN